MCFESCPEVRRNRINNNYATGILIANGSTPLVENNHVTENEVAGIVIKDNSLPKLIGNYLNNNEVNFASENYDFNEIINDKTLPGRNIIPKKYVCNIF